MGFISDSPFVVAIIGAVVLLVLVAYLLARRIKAAGPNGLHHHRP